MAWLTGWGKRKKLPSVISSDGALTDYQMITNVMTRSAAWATGMPVYVGQIVQISNGKTLQCTVAGTTSATEPTAAGAESGGPTWIERPDIVYIPRASVKNATLDDLRITAGDGTTIVPHHIPGRDIIPIVSADCSGNLNTSAWLADGTLIGGFTDCLKLSTDRGRTWSAAIKTWTNSDRIYCVYVFVSGGVEYVYASPYSNATPFLDAADTGLFRTTAADIKGSNTGWTRVIDLSARGTSNVTIWHMDMDSAGRIFAGEYGSEVATLYRSLTDGASFAAAYNFNVAPINARHLHDVKCDPWNSDTIYVTHGDLIGGAYSVAGIYKSTDHGDTFTEILAALPQVTSIVCTPECRYFASDDGSTGTIYRTTDDVSVSNMAYLPKGSIYTAPKKTMWFWGTRNPESGAVYFGSANAANDGTMDSYICCIRQYGSLPDIIFTSGAWVTIGDGTNFVTTNWYQDTILVGMIASGAFTTCKKIIDQHTSSVVFKPSTINNSDFFYYYGNQAATNSEDSASVYLFYDAFSGTTLDTTDKWNAAPAISNGGGAGTVAFTVGSGSLLARLTAYNGSGATLQSVKITSKTALAPPVRLMSRINSWRSNSGVATDAAAAAGTELGLVGTLASGMYSHEHSIRYYSVPTGTFNHIVRGSAVTNAAIAGRLDEPLILTTKSSASGCKMFAAAEATPQIGTQLTSYPSGTMYVGIGFNVGSTVANDTFMSVDYVAALLGTANEPTYSLWAAEESAPTATAYTETLETLITAGISAADAAQLVEALTSAAQSSISVTDTIGASTVAENLLSAATSIASASDLQLMVDNLIIMATSGASIGEISAYLEQLTAAASSSTSVTDLLVADFVGRYLGVEYAIGRGATSLLRRLSTLMIDKPAYNQEWRICNFRSPDGSGPLNEDETVQSVESFMVQDIASGTDCTATMISGVAPYNGTQVRYQIKGGTAGRKYLRTIRIVSSNGQKVEDRLAIKVT